MMDVDLITKNIKDLFENACFFEDMRDYYYTIRFALDKTFSEAVEHIVDSRYEK